MALNRGSRPSGWRITETIAGLVVVLLVVYAGAVGGAGLPPLGPAFNPGTGVWKISPEATGVSSGGFALPGLHAPATVSFESDGIPHITTGDDSDLWRVIGYVQAHFRLTQMDLERREGNGTVAQVIGAAAVPTDELELGLGLRRAAERDWAQLPAGPSRTALTDYSDGINSAISQIEAAHELPPAFTLLGYRPAAWSPVDTLVIQRLETQDLAFTTTAATFSHLAGALGPKTFADLFPATPADANQHPYDPGPYTTDPLTPLPVRADPATDASAARPSPPPATVPGPAITPAQVGALLAALPVNQVHTYGDSNAFAVAGTKTVSGKPLQESDPHLGFTLPAIWYQVEASSPSYHFAGVTIPGTPVPLIGRTDNFSWGITDAQHPTTLYYLEKTDPSKPDQYFWKGAWHRMSTIDYSIAVKGGASVAYPVRFGAQGPMITSDGVTASVWWGGTLPSDNISAVMNMLHAKDFTSFRASLQPWTTPPQNFVYADRSGTIGAFGVGLSPQVPGHDIGLPLPGDGSADVTGAIPYADLPHVQNPPSGYLATANQREVAADYPYQYSNSYNFPDQGWRAAEISEYLSNDKKRFTAKDIQTIQFDQHDQLAEQIVPALLQALKGRPMNKTEYLVYAQLSTWDDDMTANSLVPTVFSNFVNHLAYVVFQPYWAQAKVGDDPDRSIALQPFGESAASDGLQALLAQWIQHDPGNAYFTPPGGATRDADSVLLTTYRQTIAQLTKEYSGSLGNWEYGKHHFVQFPSLLQSAPLDGGPFSRGGSDRTINAADGSLTRDGHTDTEVSTAGPSFRFVMDWGNGTSSGIYPGGQSESPLSPWYDNNLTPWLSGTLEPMNYQRTLQGADAIATWRLTS